MEEENLPVCDQDPLVSSPSSTGVCHSTTEVASPPQTHTQDVYTDSYLLSPSPASPQDAPAAVMASASSQSLLASAGSFSKMRLRLSDADLQELPAALGAQLRHLEVFVARMRDFSDQLDKTTVQQIMRERRGQNPPLREVVEDSSQRIEQILGEVAYFLESTKPESKLPTGETDPGTSVSHGNSQLTSPSEQEKRLLADIPPALEVAEESVPMKDESHEEEEEAGGGDIVGKNEGAEIVASEEEEAHPQVKAEDEGDKPPDVEVLVDRQEEGAGALEVGGEVQARGEENGRPSPPSPPVVDEKDEAAVDTSSIKPSSGGVRGRGFALEESIISGIQKNRERYSAATEEVEEEEESGTLNRRRSRVDFVVPGVTRDHTRQIEVAGSRTLARVLGERFQGTQGDGDREGSGEGQGEKDRRAASGTEGSSKDGGARRRPPPPPPPASSKRRDSTGTASKSSSVLSLGPDGEVLVKDQTAGKVADLLTSLYGLVGELFMENAELRKLVNHYSEVLVRDRDFSVDWDHQAHEVQSEMDLSRRRENAELRAKLKLANDQQKLQEQGKGRKRGFFSRLFGRKSK